MGVPLLLCSPSSCWCFACECRTFKLFKGLACECRVFFICCRKRKSLMTLMTNDLNDHPRLVIRQVCVPGKAPAGG